MSTKKLKLRKLEIKSFLTGVDRPEKFQFKGGGATIGAYKTDCCPPATIGAFQTDCCPPPTIGAFQTDCC